ncbi:migration and invasion-inhibitory protein [Choloepus didactylus]|uniref:migration and invasion-inhibitory protein n=1 Tax=Choloepus didactylus TaxID=27675 RepID=UPI00189DB1CA|nr:migration and invasion-inhibitory protein [Choloepus didactylus]
MGQKWEGSVSRGPASASPGTVFTFPAAFPGEPPLPLHLCSVWFSCARPEPGGGRCRLFALTPGENGGPRPAGVEELGLESSPKGVLGPAPTSVGIQTITPKMVEAEELVQLRRLNLELLRQLWAGQDAMRRAVAKAALESSLDCSSRSNTETLASQEASSMAPGASSPQCECHVQVPPDVHQEDPCEGAWPGRTSSRTASLTPTKCQSQESLVPPRPHSAPVTSDLNDPELPTGPDRLGPQEAQAQRSVPEPQQSKLSKPRVTFNKEAAESESSWCLGSNWTAGSLDCSSPLSSKSEDFFSKLQEFREANRDECISRGPEPQLAGVQESRGVEDDHECVYCYRVNRRLFLVPADPCAPCRLCRIPRDQQDPSALAGPIQVRVTLPLSVLEPPYRYHIHRRKSFDASDTLALPRHCLLGWDIIPPKLEKCSAPRSLDLWSSVTSEAQHRKLLATSSSRLALPPRALPASPIWSEPLVSRPFTPWPKP